jgi:hypothetical protein
MKCQISSTTKRHKGNPSYRLEAATQQQQRGNICPAPLRASTRQRIAAPQTRCPTSVHGLAQLCFSCAPSTHMGHQSKTTATPSQPHAPSAHHPLPLGPLFEFLLQLGNHLPDLPSPATDQAKQRPTTDPITNFARHGPYNSSLPQRMYCPLKSKRPRMKSSCCLHSHATAGGMWMPGQTALVRAEQQAGSSPAARPPGRVRQIITAASSIWCTTKSIQGPRRG